MNTNSFVHEEHTATWFTLMDIISRAAALAPKNIPLVLTSLAQLPEYDIDGPPISFIHGPPGRNISLAVGLRAALPDTPILLIMNADAVTLGMNHLIHAARRNMGMTLLILRSEVTDAISTYSVQRTSWRSLGFQGQIERQATPLELALKLEAAMVARGSLEDPNQLAQLIRDALNVAGFSMIGVTSAKHLPLGILGQTKLPEYFQAYRRWAESIRSELSSPVSSKPAIAAKENNLGSENKEANAQQLPEYYDAYKCWSESVRASMNIEERDGQESTAHTPSPSQKNVDRFEIKITGLGGQGIKLAGSVLNEAICNYEGLWTTQRGEYGSATRGGPSSVEVVAGSQRVGYPGVEDPDILVMLSEAKVKSSAAATGNDRTWVIVEQDMLHDTHTEKNLIPIPINRISIEHTGKPIASGVVALGCIAAVSDIVSLASLKQSLAEKVPPKVVAQNIAALCAGYEATSSTLTRRNL